MHKLAVLSLTLLGTIASVFPPAHALEISANRLERSYPPALAKRNGFVKGVVEVRDKDGKEVLGYVSHEHWSDTYHVPIFGVVDPKDEEDRLKVKFSFADYNLRPVFHEDGKDGKKDGKDGKDDHKDGKDDHKDGKDDHKDGKDDPKDGKDDHKDDKDGKHHEDKCIGPWIQSWDKDDSCFPLTFIQCPEKGPWCLDPKSYELTITLPGPKGYPIPGVFEWDKYLNKVYVVEKWKDQDKNQIPVRLYLVKCD